MTWSPPRGEYYLQYLDANWSPFKTTDLGPAIYFTGLNIDFSFPVFLDSRFPFFIKLYKQKSFISIESSHGDDAGEMNVAGS